jgi:hypothetical protein
MAVAANSYAIFRLKSRVFEETHRTLRRGPGEMVLTPRPGTHWEKRSMSEIPKKQGAANQARGAPWAAWRSRALELDANPRAPAHTLAIA